MLKLQVDASYYSAYWMSRHRVRYKNITEPGSGPVTSLCPVTGTPDEYCYAEVKNVQGG